MSRDRDREDERDDCKIFIGGIGRDTGKKKIELSVELSNVLLPQMNEN